VKAHGEEHGGTPGATLSAPFWFFHSKLIVSSELMDDHETIRVPELQAATVFREHALRELRALARVFAGARDRDGAKPRGDPWIALADPQTHRPSTQSRADSGCSGVFCRTLTRRLLAADRLQLPRCNTLSITHLLKDGMMNGLIYLIVFIYFSYLVMIMFILSFLGLR
jgi:hypothetical protein